MTNHCLLCGKETAGSVGRAGLRWSQICQTCKDSEDAALDLHIKTLARGFKFVLGSLGLGEQGVYESRTDADSLSKEERMKQFQHIED